jgi:hypothetical protein
LRLQQEKSRIQKELDQRKADHDALKQRCVQLRAEKDHYAADNEKKQQLIMSLGEVDAELDDEDAAFDASVRPEAQTSDVT